MSKATKKEAGYGRGNPRRNCGICQMMRTAKPGPKGGSCTAVEGGISVYGTCKKYYQARKNPWRKGGGLLGK